MFTTPSRHILLTVVQSHWLRAPRATTQSLFSCRSFAWNAKWKQKAPRRKDKRKSADQIAVEKLSEQAQRHAKKAAGKRAKRGHQQPGPEVMKPSREKDFVPPALLLPTASPNVYISKVTAQNEEVNHMDLFPPHEAEQRPPLFRNNTFVYDGVETFDGIKASSVQYFDTAEVPKVAFLGRSNVGKSSLVNALMLRDLARCSKQPGRTQQVHRFALVNPNEKSTNGAPAGMFLDLPGYGFAVAPDDVLEDWQIKTQKVLRREYKEGNLRRVFVLIDARQGLASIDQTVLQWLQDNGGIPHTLVWTKSDAVLKPQLIKGLNFGFMWYQQQLFRGGEDDVPCFMSPFIHVTSTKKGVADQGTTELLSAIEAEFLLEDVD
eukprot:scaffold8325_cov165-Amphora_coffeaeformis.AAC.1